jgi:hypothetical protein
MGYYMKGESATCGQKLVLMERCFFCMHVKKGYEI